MSNEIEKYALQTDENGVRESGEEYALRLKNIRKPNALMLRTGNIIAEALKIGIYGATGDKEDKFEIAIAIDKLVVALSAYDRKAELVGNETLMAMATTDVDSDLVASALKHLAPEHKANQELTSLLVDRLRGLSKSGGQKIFMEKAEKDSAHLMLSATTEAWDELKQMAGQLTQKPEYFAKKDVPSNAVVKAFYERDRKSAASEIVKKISELRIACRDTVMR